MNENESESIPSHYQDMINRQNQVNNSDEPLTPPPLSDEKKINSLREMVKFAPNQQIKEQLEKELSNLIKNNT